MSEQPLDPNQPPPEPIYPDLPSAPTPPPAAMPPQMDAPFVTPFPPAGYPAQPYPMQPDQAQPLPYSPPANPQQSYPAQPYPQQPYPQQPYPQQPYPSQPMPQQPYPSQPYSQQPYPSQPMPQSSYPAPSMPYGFPPQAAQPYPYGAQPSGAIPPGSQPWPMMPDGRPVLAPPASSPSGLAQPLPWWALVVGWVAVIAGLAGLFISGTDWANGAFRAGIATASLGGLLLIVLVIRGASGLFAATNVRRGGQILGASLAIIALLLAGGAGIGLQSPIHTLQGSNWEKQGQWQQAITEFTQGGASAPTSEDLARTYNRWGEQLNNNGDFTGAIGKFDFVITNFGSAPIGLARAKKDDATSYYNRGEKAFTAQNYSDAIKDFKTLSDRFAQAPEVAKAHPDYAIALFALGNTQLALRTTDGCDAALPYYQQLASGFADTTQGQSAIKALKAPRHVQGQFTGTITAAPAGEENAAFLLLNPQVSASNTVSFTAIYIVAIQSNGIFVFPSTPLGSYALAFAVYNPTTKTGSTPAFLTADGTSIEIFKLQQLCSVSFTINGSPPPALSSSIGHLEVAGAGQLTLARRQPLVGVIQMG